MGDHHFEGFFFFCVEKAFLVFWCLCCFILFSSLFPPSDFVGLLFFSPRNRRRPDEPVRCLEQKTGFEASLNHQQRRNDL